MCKRFFSFTFDRGPEKGLEHTYLPTLDTFAHCRPLRSSDDVLDLSDENNAAMTGDPTVSLTHVLDIAGLFHSIDLIEKNMLDHIGS